jgi:uncharacterized protein (UPF0335 family)
MHGKGGTMSDVVGIAGDRIRSFVERIEQIETELKELTEAKKEIFSEAKGEGFDVKVLKEIIKLRKQDQEVRWLGLSEQRLRLAKWSVCWGYAAASCGSGIK